MRIRTIKPEFFRDPDTTGRWPAELKVFYIGMWCVADDAGRFVWDEDLIAADLYPFDRKVHVASLLARLVECGVVVKYEAEGRAYGYLRNFARHQRINRPSESRIPEPPENPHAGLTEPSVSGHGGLTAGKERKGRDQGSGKGSGETGSPPSPVVEVLPCVGDGPKEYGVTQSQLDSWGTAYPGVDARSEVLKAKAWLEANPKNRKTHDGMARFLVNWLSRSQNGARSKNGVKPMAFAPAEPHSAFPVTGEVPL